jgi:hypothetical protein
LFKHLRSEGRGRQFRLMADVGDRVYFGEDGNNQILFFWRLVQLQYSMIDG